MRFLKGNLIEINLLALVFNWNHFEMRFLNVRIIFIYCGLFVLILVVFFVTVSPVINAFHSCCLLRHVFDQVNLWPGWVGFETAIFWQCSPGTVETQRLYPLCHGPRRAIKGGVFGLINPYLVFHSRVRTEFLYLSLIGIILRWGFLIWELIFLFIYCGLFVLILVGSNYWGYGYKTQHSYPRSRWNRLKKARGEIWPKRSERRNNTKNYQDENKKSALNKN